MCIKPSETHRNHSAQNSSKTRRTMSWLKSCILNTSVSFIDCPNFKLRMLLLFAKFHSHNFILFFLSFIYFNGQIRWPKGVRCRWMHPKMKVIYFLTTPVSWIWLCSQKRANKQTRRANKQLCRSTRCFNLSYKNYHPPISRFFYEKRDWKNPL